MKTKLFRVWYAALIVGLGLTAATSVALAVVAVIGLMRDLIVLVTQG